MAKRTWVTVEKYEAPHLNGKLRKELHDEVDECLHNAMLSAIDLLVTKYNTVASHRRIIIDQLKHADTTLQRIRMLDKMGNT